MKFDKFNTMVIALLPAVIMVVALAFGLMFHANVCCGELVQCPNCKATVDTSTNSYHYSVVRRSYGSSGGYSYGSSGGTATPTQVMELPRPKQVIQKIRSLLNRSQGSSGGYSYGSAGGTQLPVATPKAAAEPVTSKKQ